MIYRSVMRHSVFLASLAIACGPVVDATADTATSSGGDTTTPTPEPSTTVPDPIPEPSTTVPDPIPDPETTGVVPEPTTSGFETTPDDTFDSCAFLCKPDGGDVLIECDIWTQDCPRGEKCMPWANDGGSAWNATRCSPLDDDPAGVGEPCTVEGSGVSGIDDCELGAMCFGVDEANQGTCIAMCEGSPESPTCDNGSPCVLGSDSVLALCMPTCHPVVQDCADGDACYPFVDYFVCGPVLAPGAYGDACDQTTGCNPGLFCAPAETVPACEGDTGCCTAYCDFSMMNASETCPGFVDGQACVAWYEEGQAPPGYENVGACVLP